MKIAFVRHGESEGNARGIMSGHLDVPLTELGKEQARKTSQEIASDFSVMYSSDLLRCKQTAEILNEKLCLPITYDSRLRERDFGSLQGKTWEDVSKEVRKTDVKQEYDYRPFGGESRDDVRKRLMDFIEEIKRTRGNEKILAVTSAGMIRLLHKILNNEVVEKIHNSSVHEFEF